MKTLLIAAAVAACATGAQAGVYDNPTPANANQINLAAHVSQPPAPRTDTTREEIIRITPNG